MAAANNPYFVSPPNIYDALMSGVGGYDRGQQNMQQNAIQEAGRLYAAGDLKGAMAAASQGGLAALMGFGKLNNEDRQLTLQGQSVNETGRHNIAAEGLTASGQRETNRHDVATEGLARQTLEQGKITRGVSSNPLSGEINAYELGPQGYRVLPPVGPQTSNPNYKPPGQNLGEVTGVTIDGQPTQPPAAPQAGGTPDVAAVMAKYGGKPGDGRDWNYLASLPPAAQEKVVRTANHDINPASFSTRQAAGAGDSARGALTTAASLFDKTYNQQDYPNIQQARSRFGSGPLGNTVRSLNVVVDHAGTLRDIGTALQNGNIPLFNSIAQQWAQQTGSPVPTNFDMAKAVVGTELVKALGVAGAGTGEERADLGRKITSASSPAQLNGIIDNVVRPLLGGQLKGLRQQFTTSTKQPESKFNEMLFPNTLKFLDSTGGPQQPGNTGGAQAQGAVDWKTYFGAK